MDYLTYIYPRQRNENEQNKTVAFIKKLIHDMIPLNPKPR